MTSATLKQLQPIGVLVTIIAFGGSWTLLTMGARPFDINNTTWLRGDLALVYFAWVIFMNEPWSNWLSTSMMSHPIPLSIGLFDAMPLFALLVKPFAAIVPPGQYFGWYFALCTCLQGGLGYLATREVLYFNGPRPSQPSRQVVLICLGVAIICMAAPAAMNRFTAHTALASQWMLVLAVWVSLRWQASTSWKWAIAHGPPLFLATGINPYIALQMGLTFTITTLFASRETAWSTQLGRLATLGSVGLAGLGLFGFLSGALPGGGYGLYSMNMLGPIDSNGNGLIWRLDVEDATSAQAWEGFTYIGFGAITLLIAAAAVSALYRVPDGFPYMASALIVLTAFLLALSTTVTLGGWKVHLPVPGAVDDLLARFRASGRLFWIGGIWLVFLAVAAIARKLPLQKASLIIAAAAMLQVVDVAGVTRMTRTKIEGFERLSTEISPLLASGKTARSLLVFPPWQCDPHGTPIGVRSFEVIGAFVAKEGIPTNSFYAGRTPTKQAEFHCDIEKRLATIDSESIYVVSPVVWSNHGSRFSDTHDCRQSEALGAAWICR